MMSEPTNTDMAPPTHGEFVDMDSPATKWPTVIGVIGIVLGALGVVCGCAGLFSVPLQRWGVEMQSQAGQSNPVAEAQLAAAEQFQIGTIVLVALGTILTVFLLWGSISLVRRQRSSRTTLMGWAMASLFVMMLNIALQILIYRAASDSLVQGGDSDRMAELWLGAGFGACFGLVFGLALQAFVLIWFSRKKIIAEVAEWR
jgi:hypothetical protein